MLYKLLFGPKYMSTQEEAAFDMIGVRHDELLRYKRLGMISEEEYCKERDLLLIELDNLEIKYS